MAGLDSHGLTLAWLGWVVLGWTGVGRDLLSSAELGPTELALALPRLESNSLD